MKTIPTYFNWSGGKDSTLALQYLLQENQYDVRCLLTSVNAHFNRISMHGVRVELLELQAQAIGIPLRKLLLPEMPSMEIYEQTMLETLEQLKSEFQLEKAAFGDIFLEDLRTYREENLKKVNLSAVFPLWKKDTKSLIQEFIELGYKTITTCVDASKLDKTFVGRVIDEQFLADLPTDIDPCGENGEFHTFVFDGPIFKNPIPFTKGEIIHRTYTTPSNSEENDCQTTTPTPHAGFWYCDLINN